jgi:hypothetical protein
MCIDGRLNTAERINFDLSKILSGDYPDDGA